MSKLPDCTEMRVIVPDALKADLQREQSERVQQGRKKLTLADLLVLRAIGNTLCLAQQQHAQTKGE